MIAMIFKSFLVTIILFVMMATSYLYGHNDGTKVATHNFQNINVPQLREHAGLEQIRRFHLMCAAEIPMKFTYDKSLPDNSEYVCMSLGPPLPLPPSVPPQSKLEIGNRARDNMLINMEI